MHKYKQILWIASLAGLLVSLLSGCAPKPKTPLMVIGAGSLIQPFGDLKNAFEAQHPDIDIQDEYHGSIQVLRQVSDLNRKMDVVASADRSLIPLLLYQTDDPNTGKPYANWYIQFSTNKLGLAYTGKSRYANEITAQNWYQILSRPDVKVGLADPRFDAVGYRTLMAYRLGQDFYQQPTLFFDMFDGIFTYPITVDEQNGNSLIRVPEVLETTQNARILLRGASVQALALLETGDVDYAFEYESVIQQHHLQMIHLPDQLNLSSKLLNPDYKKVTVLLDFQRFSKVKPQFQGEQIGYGITIPSNAPHPQEAAEFIAFLLSPQGRQIMEKQNYQPMLNPILADGYNNLPDSLKKLVVAAP
ncbi:MAG: tungstate ABC transporter substrate-binding protein WtpA [Anaerolineaceae bacterium]|nr:tungstate ABC transporter substrate-binding protein WtpA [Anaerolineaceae bacterium]